MNNPFQPLEHPYKWVTLHEDASNKCHYYIETEFGKTNTFVHYLDLFEYIKWRINEGTIVTIKPSDLVELIK